LRHFLFIDHGNTAIKGRVTDEEFRPLFEFTENEDGFLKRSAEIRQHFSVRGGFYSSVGNLSPELKKSWEEDLGLKAFDPLSPSPLKKDYLTPETLGPDRFAAAVGAYSLFPAQNTLILDFGTCLKIDFVDSYGVFRGGAISPGLDMRYKALHTFTAKLPLLSRPERFPDFLSGKSTPESLHAGATLGLLAEAEGIIRRYEETVDRINILLTGGDAYFFEGHVKNAIFVPQNLVLLGLAETKKYHAENPSDK
jgi:type III pantothenate kinase